MPIAIVSHLEKHQLSCAERVHSLQHSKKKELECQTAISYKRDSHTDNVKVATRAQNMLRHMVFMLKVCAISYDCCMSVVILLDE